MSRKGNCLDNAVIENFWGTLKTEWFYLNDFDSVDKFLEELESYIHYFNYERDSSVLNYRTPIEVRLTNMVA
jgi:putative transposase